MTTLQLPSRHELGHTRRWFLPLQEEDYYITVARFIGFGTSHTDNHWDHPVGEYVGVDASGKPKRCNACRWFEIRIFREFADGFTVPSNAEPHELSRLYAEAFQEDQLGDYVVYKVGASIVPGEVPYCRYDLISSPHEVVESLTVRKVDDGGPRTFITKPSAVALSSGAKFDEELEYAWTNRAVS